MPDGASPRLSVAFERGWRQLECSPLVRTTTPPVDRTITACFRGALARGSWAGRLEALGGPALRVRAARSGASLPSSYRCRFWLFSRLQPRNGAGFQMPRHRPAQRRATGSAALAQRLCLRAIIFSVACVALAAAQSSTTGDAPTETYPPARPRYSTEEVLAAFSSAVLWILSAVSGVLLLASMGAACELPFPAFCCYTSHYTDQARCGRE